MEWNPGLKWTKTQRERGVAIWNSDTLYNLQKNSKATEEAERGTTTQLSSFHLT